MRANNYPRPAHADQLHVDLWFHGHNITLDPGTYRYNFPPPWDNGLAQTRVHNTVTINNKNQMNRAGKFLWLDWAQASVLKKSSRSVSATHSGYDRDGYRHTRTLNQILPEQWQIIDEIIPLNTKKGNSQTHISLQWLLPDWDQKISSNAVEFIAPFGRILLSIVDDSKNQNAELHLVRAGKNISKGNFTDPLLGWHSPTYSVRKPAISIVYAGEQELPVKLTTTIMVIPTQLIMHILLIHQAFAAIDEPGGTRHHEFARILAGKGHQISIISSPISYLTGRDEEKLKYETDMDGLIQIHRTYTYPALHKSFFHRLISFFSFMLSSLFKALSISM